MHLLADAAPSLRSTASSCVLKVRVIAQGMVDTCVPVCRDGLQVWGLARGRDVWYF